jgi:hypothetical protein
MRMMKKKIQNLFIILFSAFFFVLASGIIITWHECCHEHHHAKTEHNHCHETKIFVKIEDDFLKSKATHISFPVIETVLFFSIQKIVIVEKVTPNFHHSIPPLIKLVGAHFVNFTSQRVLYS